MNTEQEELLKVIAGRPIGFIGHGHSLQQFKDNIERFRNRDICWVSLNRINIARDILILIDKDLDIVLGYSSGYENSFKDLNAFVYRYSEGRGNSLSEFLLQLNDLNIGTIFLVGCDGYSDNDVPYFSQLKGSQQQRNRHIADTIDFNNRFKDFKWNIQIYNVNLSSKYVLPKCSMDEIFYKIKKMAR